MSPVIPSTTPLREFKDHEGAITAVAVFPDRRRMITSSEDMTFCLWDLETGVVLKKMEGHRSSVQALAVSRDGQMIASGGWNGEVITWHGETGEPLTQPIKAHSGCIKLMDFSPDGTVLATGSTDRTTKLWCTKTWQPQGNPIERDYATSVRYSPSGELLAILTVKDIQIYNTDTRECVANLKFGGHKSYHNSFVWTPDGTRLLSGGDDKGPTIQEWDTSTWQQVGDPWTGHTHPIDVIAINSAGTLIASTSDDNHVCLWRLSDRRTIAIFQHSSLLRCVTFSMDGNYILSGGRDNMISEWAIPKNPHSKIFAMNSTVHHACISGDLPSAQGLLTQEIDSNANNYDSYVNHSFIMAQKHDWDHALDNAIKSISIQPSLTGYISKGIALCGKGKIQDARRAFDLASMFTNEDSQIIHFLLLIKTIALFNAHQHEEAILLVQELAAACPNADTLACRVVEAYLCVQLGINASAAAHHDEAADHFTAAVNSSAFSSKSPIHIIYKDLVVLFGWDLKSLELTAHQKRCQAFLSAGKPEEALESHQYMMDAIDETTKASCLDWSNAFKQECSALAVLGLEIPGQDQDGYNTEPDFFGGMHDRPQTSRPRPQKHMGRFKRLRLAVTKTPRPAPPPAPATTQSSATAPPTFQARIRHLLTSRPENATPHVVDVPYAQGLSRNAAAGAPGNDEDLVPIEYFDDDPPQNPNSQQQSTAVQINAGEHGGGRLCCCC